MFVSKKEYKRLEEAYAAAQNRALELVVEVEAHKKRASEFAYTAELNLSKLKDRDEDIKRLKEQLNTSNITVCDHEIVILRAEVNINPEGVKYADDYKAQVARAIGVTARECNFITFTTTLNKDGNVVMLGELKVTKEK